MSFFPRPFAKRKAELDREIQSHLQMDTFGVAGNGAANVRRCDLVAQFRDSPQQGKRAVVIGVLDDQRHRHSK